jgi:hypothetical protein
VSASKRTTFAVAAIALVLSASVGLLAARGDDPRQTAVVAATAQSAPEPPRDAAAATEPLRIDLLNRVGQPGPRRDAFRPRSWQPPPPPPPPPVVMEPVPPPPPTAPALPFTFMGRFESPGEKTVYYLLEGGKLHVVAEGDTINGTHRIKAVKDNRMDILYLPLSITQTLALGAAP